MIHWRTLKDVFYGLTAYEFARHAREMRRETDSLFLIATLGDLVGLPVMPPVFTLRVLPYVVPELTQWKRQLARSKELWEKHEYDLHGV